MTQHERGEPYIDVGRFRFILPSRAEKTVAHIERNRKPGFVNLTVLTVWLFDSASGYAHSQVLPLQKSGAYFGLTDLRGGTCASRPESN